MARFHVSSSSVAAPGLFRWFEAGSVVGCVALNGWLMCDVAFGVANHRPAWQALIGTAFGAYLCADLLAGLVHFVGDCFGTVKTPLLGSTFVLPFRSHHVHPHEICQHDFIATNGNNAFATMFVLVPVLSFFSVRDGVGSTLLGCFASVLATSLLFTNQIHKWAHVADPPALVRSMQRLGVLLSPDRHAVHHRPPYVGGYCVTSGLWNRVLDPIGFFPCLERVIRATLFLPRIKT